jgi:cytochrome c oxidase subunit 3
MGLFAKLTEKPWIPAQSRIDDLDSGGSFAMSKPWLGLNVLFAVIAVLFSLLSLAFHHHHLQHAGEYAAARARGLSFLDLCLAPGVNFTELPKLWLLWVNTAVLIVASVVIQKADNAAKRGAQDAARDYLLLAAGLTLMFLAGQIAVVQQLTQLGFFAQSTPAVAFFFLIALLHGLHLVGGMIPLGRIGAKLVEGVDIGKLRLSIELCAAYWHFLLLVWFVVFLTLLLT